MQVVLVTGISGSGKSVAIRALEDDGYFCIDNLPARFLQEVIVSLEHHGYDRVAVAIDARSGATLEEMREVVSGVTATGHDVKVLFLNARTDVLVQRYSETRRRHPLAAGRTVLPGTTPSLLESIEKERDMMSSIEDIGLMIDTSNLRPSLLQQWVRDMTGSRRASMTLLFESFAYKQGVPIDANLVFDVRCLPNPFYVPALKPLTGLDTEVAAYLSAIPDVERMVDDIQRFVDSWMPMYMQENRSYMTVAIGCTGGQHRSVHVVEQLAKRFRRDGDVLVRHRAIAARETRS
jgi:RNase adapter protein RapZ